MFKNYRLQAAFCFASLMTLSITSTGCNEEFKPTISNETPTDKTVYQYKDKETLRFQRYYPEMRYGTETNEDKIEFYQLESLVSKLEEKEAFQEVYRFDPYIKRTASELEELTSRPYGCSKYAGQNEPYAYLEKSPKNYTVEDLIREDMIALGQFAFNSTKTLTIVKHAKSEAGQDVFVTQEITPEGEIKGEGFAILDKNKEAYQYWYTQAILYDRTRQNDPTPNEITLQN